MLQDDRSSFGDRTPLRIASVRRRGSGAGSPLDVNAFGGCGLSKHTFMHQNLTPTKSRSARLPRPPSISRRYASARRPRQHRVLA